MARKKKDIPTDNTLEEVKQGESPPANIEDTLTPKEKKAYRRLVRKNRRAEWLDEYWIITILSLVVLALMITLTIGKAVSDKIVEQEEIEDIDIMEEDIDTYNIQSQMNILL